MESNKKIYSVKPFLKISQETYEIKIKIQQLSAFSFAIQYIELKWLIAIAEMLNDNYYNSHSFCLIFSYIFLLNNIILSLVLTEI